MSEPVHFQNGIYICDTGAVEEKGRGVRFPVSMFGHDATGFVVRFEGEVHAYLNRCAHVPIELDWNEGDFFESGKQFLMCSTHGAVYNVKNGRCAGGPCRGGRLRVISVYEADGKIYWLPDDDVRPALA